MSVVAIIPARAGSKGLPGKNLRAVGGLSLVGRAVRAARHAGVVQRIVVSTDGADIAREAASHGAEVVTRPAALAEDASRSIDVVLHALEALELQEGICVLLQPTSPLREARDVRHAVERFLARNAGGSVVAVCESEHHPYKAILERDGRYVPLLDYPSLEAPRQSLPRSLRVNGAIYVNDIAGLKRARSFFFGPLDFYEMPVSRSVDIDRESDLVLANMLSR